MQTSVLRKSEVGVLLMAFARADYITERRDGTEGKTFVKDRGEIPEWSETRIEEG